MLERRFLRRFDGLMLRWNEATKCSGNVQKFTLIVGTTGEKLRIFLIENAFFENDQVEEFLNGFEQRFEEFTRQGGVIRFAHSRFSS